MKTNFARTLLMLALTAVIGLSVTGGTIAWFTDSVTSNANVIQSGNLDVTLEYYNAASGKFEAVTEQTKLFKENSLWEPGYTEVAYLKVANAGNLALKYRLAVNVTNEVAGTNVYDAEFKLSDYLASAAKPITADEVGKLTREQVMTAAGSTPMATYTTADIPMEVQSAAHYYALAVCMPTNVDNNANHKAGTAAPSLDLGVKLTAIQHTSETDSFGNDYDQYALLADHPWNGETIETPTADVNGVFHITSAAQLVGMMNDSKYPNCNTYQNVVLDCDIDLNGATISGFGDGSGFFDGIFDGQGHTISNFKINNPSREYYAGLFNQVSQYSGENTVIKNLTVANATIIGNGAGQVGAIVGGMNGNTIVDNCKVIDCTLMGVKKVGAVVGYTAGGTVTNNYAENCKVYYSEKEGGEILGYENIGSTVNNNTANNVTVEKIDTFSDGLLKKGNVIEVSNANGLEALNKMMANKTAGRSVVVNITEDIDFSGKTWTPVDSHADTAFTMQEINGNGHTISNLTINGQAMFSRFAGTGDVTINNLTFDNANVNSNGSINTSILTVQSYQNVLLDNVDVKNSSITGGYKVAPLIGTVYNESPTSTITATLKNCDVSNTTVKATSFDFCTTGMVAFVYEGDNDKIEFENCTVSNVKLYAKPNGYTAHAWIYTNGGDTDDLFNEAPGVTVTNCTFEAL